ncbi:alpha-xylosidase [Gracilibacillus boraciitolerans JCM 21714]|uniref:Alpha-xylosidase n=1 Tax=Gracilibacillus boraciitolerans JCM 21714 TaxID=1298598 RepID=W4VPY0_9BACI|nr:TIM-barrel domain-containing protein [Gracilibacillus boraciitolerans]GAE95267.1 alpha-xylosidase [Gracilibacillus boraciitolerans JCM 21714]
MIVKKENALVWKFGNETLMIEPWLENSFRVRSTKYPHFNNENNALENIVSSSPDEISISEDGTGEIKNGKIKATVDIRGKVTFTNQKGEILLEEYQRVRNDAFEEGIVAEKLELFNSALNIKSREFKPIIGGDYALTVRFEANKIEKIFGMGQYQQDFLDLKNCRLELAHRNSQASVPFALSNKGYGFLWNNPAIGEVTFGKNLTEWKSYSTKEIDYWITAGDNPAEIEEKYADATGKVPMMPEYGMGFWQSKLRYQTQEELLEAAREYKRRGLPIDVIVCDYYHWPLAVIINLILIIGQIQKRW